MWYKCIWQDVRGNIGRISLRDAQFNDRTA